MKFGIKKCGVVVLKRGKLCRTESTQLINGRSIKEVDDKGYKYLELDKFKDRKIKDDFKKSTLNGLNLS